MKKTKKNEPIKSSGQQIINHLKMDVDNATVNIQIRIVGLIGNNYQLQIENNLLTISALIKRNRADNIMGKMATFSSSIALPCRVKASEIVSTSDFELLNITIQRDLSQDRYLIDQTGNHKSKKYKPAIS
jgi:HSP20 family molecular chaperone IbpA